MKKIFIVILVFFLFGKLYSNYESIITLPNWEIIKMVGSETQINEWTNVFNSWYNTSFDSIRKDIINIVENDPAHKWIWYSTNTPTSIGCNNGASFHLLSTTSTSTSTTPPPAPAPVISTSSNTQNSCSSYISSWSTTWSQCSVNWVWWPNGTIQCTQSASHSSNYSWCWSQVCTTTYSDGVATWTSCGPCTWCPWNAPRPTVSSATKTISLNLSNPTLITNNAYANNSDKNIIRVWISWNTNQNRNIVFWVQWVFNNFIDLSNVSSNRISNTWEALNINYSNSINTISPNSTILNIEVASRSPLLISWAKIWFKAWSTQMVLNNVSYNFKKPFTWKIETWDNVNDNWNWAPVLWTQWKYRLLLDQKSNLTWNWLQNYTLNDFSSRVESTNSDLEIQWTTLSWSTLTSKQWTIFTTRINTSETATSMPSPELQINLAEVYYTLWGQTVWYYLSENDWWNDTTVVKTSGSEFAWVLIIWSLQWGWKSEFTWQEANISELSTSQLRNGIRKNAYSYIRSMNSWDIIGWVKYVEWDYEIEANPTYDTLVVKDWNVIIWTDLNTSLDKVLWIIVLKDNYDVSNWYNNWWNVYVKPWVKKINAFIYSDWVFISVDNNANVFPTDSIERTNQLRNQLIMNGSLFSRNTIWWSILAWWDYTLPWGSKTTNFDLAMQYDLNYVRRWNLGCDKNANGVCTDIWEYNNWFVIKYDSRIQVTPPKLFSN